MNGLTRRQTAIAHAAFNWLVQDIQECDDQMELEEILAEMGVMPAPSSDEVNAVRRMLLPDEKPSSAEDAGTRALSVLEDLVGTIDATGGCARDDDGNVCPEGDPDWSDLGDVYLAACSVLGRAPLINQEDVSPEG
jgi:hypothetical protein